MLKPRFKGSPPVFPPHSLNTFPNLILFFFPFFFVPSVCSAGCGCACSTSASGCVCVAASVYVCVYVSAVSLFASPASSRSYHIGARSVYVEAVTCNGATEGVGATVVVADSPAPREDVRKTTSRIQATPAPHPTPYARDKKSHTDRESLSPLDRSDFRFALAADSLFKNELCLSWLARVRLRESTAFTLEDGSSRSILSSIASNSTSSEELE